MNIHFSASNISVHFQFEDDMISFMLWLAQGINNERTKALCTLMAEYDKESDPDEKKNIENTLIEILRDETLATSRTDPL